MYFPFHFSFKKPAVKQVVLDKLDIAQRGLLDAQEYAEYYAKLAEYYQGVVDRLAIKT